MPLSLDWCRPRTGCWIRVLRPMRLSSAATTVVVPGQITANLRITKAFGLGPLKGDLRHPTNPPLSPRAQTLEELQAHPVDAPSATCLGLLRAIVGTTWSWDRRLVISLTTTPRAQL
jgi:hypothetical protein